MASRRTRTPRRLLFHFLGTVDGAASEIALAPPVRRTEGGWTARLEMKGAFREALDVGGATRKQAVELAYGLCHMHVRGRELVDRTGARVRVPGAPLQPPTDVDDGVRGERGVCVCLVDEGDGRVRIVLDDMKRHGGQWRAAGFFTHVRYPAKRARAVALSTKELAAIGEAVVTRLAASSHGGRR